MFRSKTLINSSLTLFIVLLLGACESTDSATDQNQHITERVELRDLSVAPPGKLIAEFDAIAAGTHPLQCQGTNSNSMLANDEISKLLPGFKPDRNPPAIGAMNFWAKQKDIATRLQFLSLLNERTPNLDLLSKDRYTLMIPGVGSASMPTTDALCTARDRMLSYVNRVSVSDDRRPLPNSADIEFSGSSCIHSSGLYTITHRNSAFEIHTTGTIAFYGLADNETLGLIHPAPAFGILMDNPPSGRAPEEATVILAAIFDDDGWKSDRTQIGKDCFVSIKYF